MEELDLIKLEKLKQYKFRMLFLLKRWIIIRTIFISLLIFNLIIIGFSSHGLSILSFLDGKVNKNVIFILNLWFIVWYVIYILTAIFLRHKLNKDENLDANKFNKILIIYFIASIFLIFSIIIAPLYISRLEKIKNSTINSLY